MKAQLSFEAIFMFSVYLAALVFLLPASVKIGEYLLFSSEYSKDNFALSSEALAIETALYSVPYSEFVFSFEGYANGTHLYSDGELPAAVPLFYSISKNRITGDLNVWCNPEEPI